LKVDEEVHDGLCMTGNATFTNPKFN